MKKMLLILEKKKKKLKKSAKRTGKKEFATICSVASYGQPCCGSSNAGEGVSSSISISNSSKTHPQHQKETLQSRRSTGCTATEGKL